MNQTNAAPLFPEAIVFPDVDAETLAKEDTGYRSARSMLSSDSAWNDYLRKFLPQVTPRHQRLRAS